MLSLAFVPRGARVALIGLLAATLLFAACNGDEEEDTGDDVLDTPAAETPTETPALEETETPEATETPEETETPADEADDEAAATGATVTVSEEGDLAPYLVGPDGLTLYTFANDEPGVSNCTDECLDNWPPLTVPEGEEPTAGDSVTGELGVIEREDGTRQVTYNEQPLYYFAQDQAPGDTTGHEVGDIWFVATP